MKQIPEDTRELLDRVVGRTSSVHRCLWTKDTASVLREIGRSGTAPAIPHLLPFLFEGNSERGIRGAIRRLLSRGRGNPTREIVDAAGESVALILSRTKVGDLPALDESVRPGWHLGFWAGLNSLAKLPTVPGRPPGLLGIASFHPDGRFREKAIRALAQVTDGSELPYLIIRLNDWVAKVRRLAEQEVVARTHAAYASHLVACLPLVTRLGRLRRGDHSRVSSAIHRLLLAPVALPALLDAVGSTEDGSVRREALRYITDSHGVPWGRLTQMTSRDPDLLVRLWTVREASRQLSNQDALRLLGALTVDPHLAVRIEALRVLLGLPGARVVDFLRSAVLDPAGSVREFARYYLKNLGVEEDFAALYREALDSGNRRVTGAALGGLGETGTKDDIPRILPFLESRSSRDVRVGLRALARLSHDGSRPIIWRYVSDSRRGVRRMAARLLAPTVTAEDFESLRCVLIDDRSEDCKVPAVWLARRMDVWPQIQLLLAVKATKGSDLAGAIEFGLSSWHYGFLHSPYAPRPAEMHELENAEALIERAERWLSADVVRSVREILEGERRVKS